MEFAWACTTPSGPRLLTDDEDVVYRTMFSSKIDEHVWYLKYGTEVQKTDAASALATLAEKAENCSWIRVAGGIGALVDLTTRGTSLQKDTASLTLQRLAEASSGNRAEIRAAQARTDARTTRHGPTRPDTARHDTTRSHTHAAAYACRRSRAPAGARMYACTHAPTHARQGLLPVCRAEIEEQVCGRSSM